MDKIKTSEDIDHHRRRFFGTAAMAVAAAQFGMAGFAAAQPGKHKQSDLPTIRPGMHTFTALSTSHRCWRRQATA